MVRQQERRENDRLKQEDEKARADREVKVAALAAQDRKVRIEGLLIIMWPLMIQTRSQMAHVLRTLSVSVKRSPAFEPSPHYYADYEIGVPEEWVRIEKGIFLLGEEVAIPIFEMLAILRQFDRDIAKLERRGQQIDFLRYSDFIATAKMHADTATNKLELSYAIALKRETKRAIFWPPSATAAAKQARTMGRVPATIPDLADPAE